MIKQIKSLVQFSRGTSTVLDGLPTLIPDGVIIYSIDDGVFKLGNGTLKYSELPTLFTYQEMVSAQGGISGIFEDPEIADNGKVVIVKFDAGTNDIYYGVSDVSLVSVLTDISALEEANTTQTATIGTNLSKALMLDSDIVTASDDNVIVINNRRYTNSGITLTNVQNQIASQVTYTPGSHLEEAIFYSTQNKTTTVNKLNIPDDSSVYVDVIGFNNNESTLVYGLTAANANVTIQSVSGSLFKVTFDSVTSGIKDNTPIVLIASVDNVAGTAKVEKVISCLIVRQRIIATVYGGSSNDRFYGVAVDSSDNIICVGETSSEGSGGDALVVKFDSNMDIIARKIYGGSSTDRFYGVAVDSSDNIICVGSTASEGLSGNNALVVKFDSSLNIAARKIYSGNSGDYFESVAIDGSNNIICVGYTGSEGAGSYDILIVKFDSSLNIVARKYYGGTGVDYFQDVAIDSSDNIICAGYTNSEGSGNNDALVVKFDSSLNIVARKYYGGTGADYFQDVAIDSSDNIICVGATSSEGVGQSDALVVKFDSSLNIVARKYYGGSVVDQFNSVDIDSSDNIICVGYTNSGRAGGTDTLVVKFNQSLNIEVSKCYGGGGADEFWSVAIDSFNNIICVGYTGSEGSGSYDALILKLPNNIPSGTHTGTILTNLTLTDSTLTLANSNLTLANSTLTLANSTLTLANSTLTLANSTLTLEKDILN